MWADNITLYISYKGIGSIGNQTHPCYKMKWYALVHEQFLPFSLLISFHHSGTSLKILFCQILICLFLFTFWGKPSVLTLVKTSLDWWLWHNTVWSYLLEGVLDVTKWFSEGVFLPQGNTSSVIHQCCFPWSSGPFGVPEFISAFFSVFLSMYQIVGLAKWPNAFAIWACCAFSA